MEQVIKRLIKQKAIFSNSLEAILLQQLKSKLGIRSIKQTLLALDKQLKQLEFKLQDHLNNLIDKG